MPYKNPEDGKTYARKFRKEHPDYSKNWKKEHPEACKKHAKTYSQSVKGKEKIYKNIKKYQQTEKGKETQRKADKKYKENHPKEMYMKYRKHRYARRNLGFIVLNERFSKSHAHHIDKDYVIYIPAELHKSISHNIWTGKGMEKINKKTFEWLDGESLEENILKKIEQWKENNDFTLVNSQYEIITTTDTK